MSFCLCITLHVLVYFSQHTSLSTDQMTSLTSHVDIDNLDTEDDKEEMFSQAEMEFRNSLRSLDREHILRCFNSYGPNILHSVPWI